MLSKYVQEYHDYLIHRFDKIILDEQNQKSIDAAAKLMATIFQQGGNIFAYGPTHAGMFAEEMFYRAGGLVITNPLFHPGLMCNVRPATVTSGMEALPGFAGAIIKDSPIKKDDVLIVHSVAGRTPVVVEMAREARKKGAYVIAIVNMNYATQVTSKDPSGKMLFEECDLLIDTMGDLGDACIEIPGIEQKVAPASSVLCTYIANVLILQTCEWMLKMEMVPPIFQSANIDGGGEYNEKLLQQFKDQIFYM